MCIAAFIWQAHSFYPFLLLQNRDEYHNRPTKAVGWWEGNDILGGRDEIAGGIWLACSKQGRVAFVTNVLELHTLPDAKSRGDLPVRFLKSAKTPMEYAEEVAKEAYEFNGFNLILVDVPSKTMVYVSNRPKGNSVVIQEVQPGIHVLSNANLDSPWHKAQRLGLNFKETIRKYGGGEIPVRDIVAKLMTDTVRVADNSKLPHICSPDWELNMSSIFVQVHTPQGCYGTRSMAALTVRDTGEVSFYEKYLENKMWNEHTVKFYIEKPKLELKPQVLME